MNFSEEVRMIGDGAGKDQKVLILKDEHEEKQGMVIHFRLHACLLCCPKFMTFWQMFFQF